jgi:hypothetical protein
MYSGEADVSPTRKTLAYIFLKLELGGVRKPNMQQLIVFYTSFSDSIQQTKTFVFQTLIWPALCLKLVKFVTSLKLSLPCSSHLQA